MASASAAQAAHHAKKNRENNKKRAIPITKKSQEELPETPIVPQEGIWKYQPQVYAFYTKPSIEYFVALLIVANFITNVVEKQIDPEINRIYENTWQGFMYFYNTIFLIELLVNMYGSWLYKFWRDGWNVFDFVVVSIGFLDMCQIVLPPPMSMLRMLRAFRVFRLFKRVESLRKILVSIARAVPGVLNAFLILLIVMSIYAILAVELFKFEDTYIDANGTRIEYVTGRGNSYGDEYFGNFFKSLYTMFQVLTGESWSEAVARPLLNGINRDDRLHNKWNFNASLSAVFFVSFQLLCSIVLINVVVAVLLEKMVDPEEDEHDDEQAYSEIPAPIEMELLEDGKKGGKIHPDLKNSPSHIATDCSVATYHTDVAVTSSAELSQDLSLSLKEGIASISDKIDSLKEETMRDIQAIKLNAEHADENLKNQIEEIRSLLDTLMKNAKI